MKTAIVTDSNCAISQEKAKKYGVYVLPMPFYVDDELYFEDFGLNVNKVNEYEEDDYPWGYFDKEQERQKRDEQDDEDFE